MDFYCWVATNFVLTSFNVTVPTKRVLDGWQSFTSWSYPLFGTRIFIPVFTRPRQRSPCNVSPCATFCNALILPWGIVISPSYWSVDSLSGIVSRLWAGHLRKFGSIPSRCRLLAPTQLPIMSTRGCFALGEGPQRGADYHHLWPKFKTTLRYTPTPIASMACTVSAYFYSQLLEAVFSILNLRTW
jgi:hypothetical protein